MSYARHLDPVKLYTLNPQYTITGNSVVFPQCYMLLCPCIYRLERYGHLNNSCRLCFLFRFVFFLFKIMLCRMINYINVFIFACYLLF